MIRKGAKVLCIGSEEAYTLRRDYRTHITMYQGLVSYNGVTEVISSGSFNGKLGILVYKKGVSKVWFESISTSEPHALDELEGYLLFAWKEEGTPTVNFLVATARDDYYEGMICHYKLKNVGKKSEKIYKTLRANAELMDIELPEDELRRVIPMHKEIEENKESFEAAEVEKD